MSDKRQKKREEIKARRALYQAGVLSRQVLTPNEMNLRKEIDYIVKLAQDQQAACRCVGPLTLFSTENGDAWILDGEDHLACPLAFGGDEQPVRIIDTETTFGLEWPRRYKIDGDLFTTVDKTGRIVTVSGYPLDAIVRTMEMSVRERKALGLDES